MADASKQSNWWDDLPAPRRTAPLITRETVLSQLFSPDLLLVDVRRTDYEGGTITGSLNLPAQSFYWNRGVLYDLCKRAGIKKVAFYCGSSRGRGTRCSAWFADYIAEEGESADYIGDTDLAETDVKSLTLVGGIKGWVKAGEEYTQNIDGFEAEYWKQFDEAGEK
ncbi:Rhodanese-like protein [Melanomma pulvis-pyrius CBS 109.77]|uniref:Rhodanese-like protein n=1 Tax=Melanomma pulvis-pyrius CBS 109.77 TaxID=1314802 RepID=A0A6A6X1Z4_9PLEO|nr:Rhodanese-like protein [Melanomma pulvis-pyrius CBS 109.77]